MSVFQKMQLLLLPLRFLTIGSSFPCSRGFCLILYRSPSSFVEASAHGLSFGNHSLMSFIESSDVGTLLNVPMVSSRAQVPLPVSDVSSFEPSLLVDFLTMASLLL